PERPDSTARDVVPGSHCRGWNWPSRARVNADEESVMGEVPLQTGSDQAGRGDACANEPVTTPETTRPAQMAKIFGYLKGLHATHLIDLGRKLGLFEELAAEPVGAWPEALAARPALHQAYVRQWCETACGLELLDYDPVAGYHLAPFMDDILARPDATYYLGG